jgi:ribosomal protein L37AE/L43A
MKGNYGNKRNVPCPKCKNLLKLVDKKQDIWICKNGCYTVLDADKLFRDIVLLF